MDFWTGAGTAATTAAKAPATPAPPAAAAPSPVDYGAVSNTDPFGLIAAATSGGNRSYGDTVAQANQNEDAAGLDYGYNLQRDANGNVIGYTQQQNVLATNPFSKAAELQQSYLNSQRGTTNNLASQGQLYSGALANQQALNTQSYDQGGDALAKALQGIISGQEGVKTSAATTNAAGVQQAKTNTLSQLLGMTPDQLKSFGLT